MILLIADITPSIIFITNRLPINITCHIFKLSHIRQTYSYMEPFVCPTSDRIQNIILCPVSTKVFFYAKQNDCQNN